MCLSRTFFNSSFCARPTSDSTTWPPLKMRMVGMPRIWNLKETLGFSSTLSLPTVTLPAYSAASASTVGAMRLQGPHHSAQKSTSTGAPAFSTSCSKFPSVKVCMCSFAIRSGPLLEHSIVYFDVLFRRTVPRKIPGHPGALQRPPLAGVPECLQRPPQAGPEPLGRVIVEHEAGFRGNRVGQAADGMDDRNGAVTHAV